MRDAAPVDMLASISISETKDLAVSQFEADNVRAETIMTEQRELLDGKLPGGDKTMQNERPQAIIDND